MEIDRKNYHILEELQGDGRLSNTELAKRVCLSESATLRRVKLLEDTGVIEGYFARINPALVGKTGIVFAEISLVSQKQEQLDIFEEAVKEVVRLRSLLLSATEPESTEDIPVVTFSPEAFRKAAAAGDLLTVKAHVLAAAKEDTTLIDQANIDLETGLHLACQAGNSDIVNCIIQASAKLDLKDDYGLS